MIQIGNKGQYIPSAAKAALKKSGFSARLKPHPFKASLCQQSIDEGILGGAFG
jgi:hypothetical protein